MKALLTLYRLFSVVGTFGQPDAHFEILFAYINNYQSSFFLFRCFQVFDN